MIVPKLLKEQHSRSIDLQFERNEKKRCPCQIPNLFCLYSPNKCIFCYSILIISLRP